jgi:hypothetical protein
VLPEADDKAVDDKKTSALEEGASSSGLQGPADPNQAEAVPPADRAAHETAAGPAVADPVDMRPPSDVGFQKLFEFL